MRSSSGYVSPICETTIKTLILSTSPIFRNNFSYDTQFGYMNIPHRPTRRHERREIFRKIFGSPTRPHAPHVARVYALATRSTCSARVIFLAGPRRTGSPVAGLRPNSGRFSNSLFSFVFHPFSSYFIPN